MRNSGKGIALAGNLLVDNVKRITTYPGAGMLADIVSCERAVGGCVPNTAIDLSKIDQGVPLKALGRVGDDEAGAYIIRQLEAHGIQTNGVIRSPGAGTSFSDAMNAMDTGERAFFHYRGANAEFSPGDIHLDTLSCDMLHIGYLLLLDRFDAPDAEYGTVMARFLHEVQARGIKTSIDVVSDKNGRFAQVVKPSLPYCDCAVMNEIEGCATVGLPSRDGAGRLLKDNVVSALYAFKQAGLRGRAVIHCPEAGFCVDERGELSVVPSYKLPKGFIKGSVGAGDAFCAGCLYAVYRDYPPEEMLRFAAGAAAASLSQADAVSGMRSQREIIEMTKNWEMNT